MTFIEANSEWNREAAWATARVYATACRANPHLRTWGVIARPFQLAGKDGPRWAWRVFAGPLTESGRPE